MWSFANDRPKSMSGTGWGIWGFLGGICVALFAFPVDFYAQLWSFPYPQETYEKFLGLVGRVAIMGCAGAGWAYMCRTQTDQMLAFTLGAAGPAFIGAILAANTPFFLNGGGATSTSFEIRLISPSYAVGPKTEEISVSKKEHEWISKELKNTKSLIDDLQELLHIAFAVRRILRRELSQFSSDERRDPRFSDNVREMNLEISVLINKIKQKTNELLIIEEKMNIIIVDNEKESTKNSFRENFIKGLLGRR